jgi:hypothetical protein
MDASSRLRPTSAKIRGAPPFCQGHLGVVGLDPSAGTGWHLETSESSIPAKQSTELQFSTAKSSRRMLVSQRAAPPLVFYPTPRCSDRQRHISRVCMLVRFLAGGENGEARFTGRWSVEPCGSHHRPHPPPISTFSWHLPLSGTNLYTVALLTITCTCNRPPMVLDTHRPAPRRALETR